MDKSSDTKGLKGLKDRKQSALKRKSEYTLDDNSRPTSSNEKAKRNKRSTRACERCRNKKIKVCILQRGNIFYQNSNRMVVRPWRWQCMRCL